MQHRQPLPSSVTSSLDPRTSASSMPTLPNSLMTTAVPAPSGVARKRRTSVVLPAPRKPVTTVTGMRAPRARLSRRPNGPASREGKRSSMAQPRRVPDCGAAAKCCAADPGPVPASNARRSRVRERSRCALRCARVTSATARLYAVRRAAAPGSSEIHLQDVQPADVAVDGVDDLALVDEHVVDLDRAGGRHRRRRRHEHADLPAAGTGWRCRRRASRR